MVPLALDQRMISVGSASPFGSPSLPSFVSQHLDDTGRAHLLFAGPNAHSSIASKYNTRTRIFSFFLDVFLRSPPLAGFALRALAICFCDSRTVAEVGRWFLFPKKSKIPPFRKIANFYFIWRFVYNGPFFSRPMIPMV